MVASRVVAMTAVDLFKNAQIVESAKMQILRKGSQAFVPEGQKPHLDYRGK